MATKTYDESTIKNLSGLNAVRERPSMFLGGSSSDGIWTAIREPLDNTLDEHEQGRNNLCHLIVEEDNTLWVIDNGPGIPVGSITVENPIDHSKVKVSALKAITGLLSTGGKFQGAYDKGSRGTHGIGLKGSNAVSTAFEVWTYREKCWWHIAYAKGKEVRKVSASNPPVLPTGTKPRKGTIVRFQIDLSVFDKGSKFRVSDAERWFETTAALSEGITLKLTIGGETRTWECEGPQSYLTRHIETLKADLLDGSDIIHHAEAMFSVALAFTNYDGVDVAGFTNGLNNREGGEHVNAIYNAVARAISPYAKKTQVFTPTDLRDGLVGIINVKLVGARFSNQAKDKLVDERAGKPIEGAVLEYLQEYFEDNPKLASSLCERASKIRSLRDQFTQNKKLVKELDSAAKRNELPEKLATADCDANERELFLVEGDSAGGSAKQARDGSFQEVLPLKGKIMNAMKSSPSDFMNSEEVYNILLALGFNPAKPDPYSNLRVARVIVLADADVDGSHIKALVLAFFQRYLPELIEKGCVYMAKPYQYLVTHNDKHYYAETKEELAKMLPNPSLMSKCGQLKGWGQVNPDVLSLMAFDTQHRQLTQITSTSPKGIKEIESLMGDDPEYRKAMLGV